MNPFFFWFVCLCSFCFLLINVLIISHYTYIVNISALLRPAHLYRLLRISSIIALFVISSIYRINYVICVSYIALLRNIVIISYYYVQAQFISHYYVKRHYIALLSSQRILYRIIM
jgi:hypothetical protein